MNLSFLNQAFLWALPLAGLPIILHLLFRKKPRHRYFSYLHFIKLATRRNLPRSRLRNFLLLLVRCLILLVITLLFSRPVLHLGSGHHADGDVSRSFVILIDNSYSMGFQAGDRTYFEQVKDTAGSLLKNLNESDRAGIVFFSNKVEFASGKLTNDISALEKDLNKTALSSNPTDVLPALDTAYRLLENSPSENNVIVVFSDFTRSGWKKIIEDSRLGKNEMYGLKARFIIADIDQTADNMAIIGLDLKGDYFGETAHLTASVKNFNGSSEKQGLSIFWNGIKKLENIFEVKGRERASKIFRVVLSDENSVLLTGKLNADDLAADNIYHVYKDIQPIMKVLVIDGDPRASTVKGETYFIRTALSPEAGVSGIGKDVVTLDEFLSKGLAEYDIVFSCNVGDGTEKYRRKIHDYLTQGGRVLFTFGDRTNKEVLSALSSVLPVEVLSLKTVEEGVSFAVLERKHPFIAKLNLEKDYDPGNIKFYKYYLVRGKIGTKMIAALDNGHPLLMEKNIGRGKVMAFCSSIDRDWTNFPVKPLYPVFFQELARFASRNREKILKKNHWYAGESLAAKDILITGNDGISGLTLVKPGGDKESIDSMVQNYGDIALDEPGIYFIEYRRDGVRFKEGFDVNLAELGSEGDYEKISLDGIKGIFEKSDVARVLVDEKFVKRILIMLQGKEISKYFFWVLLALLMIETLLANPRARAA